MSPFISHDEAARDLEELKSLVQTFGGAPAQRGPNHAQRDATIVHVIQRKMRPDPKTYIGSGKAEEIADLVKVDKIDVVVMNAIVKPTQLFNLRKLMWNDNPNIKVWDRIDLILNIFDKNAHTAEAKLQIELARMRHMGPQIYGLGGTVLSRQGGGIGTRGLGETNIELMKRHWRNEMKVVTDKLTKITTERERQLMRRQEIGFKTISIVGYTNAGKSTLFNRLTGKQKRAADALFATLDSNVGKVYLQKSQRSVLVSDTIGFIQNLPTKLIEAFKSTLMESVNADLLLHVIDAADTLMHEKIAVVEGVLHELGIYDKPRIYVFNKVDSASAIDAQGLREVYENYHPIFISAKSGEGMEELMIALETFYSVGTNRNP